MKIVGRNVETFKLKKYENTRVETMAKYCRRGLISHFPEIICAQIFANISHYLENFATLSGSLHCKETRYGFSSVARKVAHDETELQFGARNESLRTKLKTPRNQAKIYNCGKKLEKNFSSLTVISNIELAGSELTFQINLSHSIWCTLKLVIIFYGFW